MTPLVIGWIGLGVFLILMAVGMQIGLAMAIVSIVGLLALGTGWDAAWSLPVVTVLGISAQFAWLVLPLFILMGNWAFYSGVVRGIFTATYRWTGGLPGALAMACVLTCAAHAALTGSSVASVAAVGKIVMPEMKRFGYNMRFAAGCVAAAGSLAILIPPSIVLVLYAILTDQSIGQLLLAGIIPGLVATASYVIMIYVAFRLHPELGPVAPKFSALDKLASLQETWHFLLIIFTTVGGLYFGLWTPTEAAAGGAFGVFLLALALRKLNIQTVFHVLTDSLTTNSSIFLILVGSLMFQRFLSLSGLASALIGSLEGLHLGFWPLLILILMLYSFLGMFLDGVSAMVLTLPLLVPVVENAGFNLIWFGVVVTKLVEIGLITPPVALNVYTLRAVYPELSLREIFRGTFPFLFVEFVQLGLFILFPDIVLWLPQAAVR